MNALETEFLERYKALSAFCNQIYQTNTGVSDYIAEMEATTHYLAYHVMTWQEDLTALKRLRWLRNCIVHEPGPSACRKKDLETLETLYGRFLTQQDPLAIIARHRREYAAKKQMQARQRADMTFSREMNASGRTARHLPTVYERLSERQRTIIVIIVVIFVAAAFIAIMLTRHFL